MTERVRVIHEDCVTAMARLPDASVAAIVCDPPYGLEFMGKAWDKLGGDAASDLGTGLGERETPWVGYGGDPLGGANPTCAVCGGRKRGANVCACAAPDWRVKGEPVSPRSAGRAMQESHAAWAAEALRVLKPGGYLLAFGGSRTFHRLACAIEDVGFEVRDSIVWMYGQGFPKSLNLDGEHAGWGTALKPGMEPIVVARKPLSERTVAANVVKHGTGALNIDGCRIGENPGYSYDNDRNGTTFHGSDGARIPRTSAKAGAARRESTQGRWPANVVLSHVPDAIDVDGNEILGCRCVGTQTVKRELRDATAAVNESDGWGNMQGSRSLGATVESQPVWECAPGCPVAALDAQSGVTKSQGGRAVDQFRDRNPVYGGGRGLEEARDPGFGDEGGASRFFYQSKATNRERWGYCHDCDVVFNRGVKADRAAHKPHKIEYHPTVKPVDLMRWLVRLVTPPGGTVLDPFAGTGTTGEAAIAEGFQFIGIEREPTYFRIAATRLDSAAPIGYTECVDPVGARSGSGELSDVAPTGLPAFGGRS